MPARGSGPPDTTSMSEPIAPGANGAVGYTSSTRPEPPASAAGLVQSTSSSSFGARPKREFGGHGPVEGREVDHAAELPRRAAGPDVSEVTAGVTALLHGYATAQQHGRDQAPADLGCAVDLTLDQLAQHERALRVAQQDHPAAPVVPSQVGAPCLAHVRVGAPANRVRDGRVAQGGEGVLPVDGGVDAAIAGIARGLVKRDRAQLGVDRLGGLHARLVAHRRVDVEAVVARALPALDVERRDLLLVRGQDRGAQARRARVVAQAGFAEPDRLGSSRCGRSERRLSGQGRTPGQPAQPST